MILSDVHIRAAIEHGRISIKPPLDYEAQLGSCSIDLRLGPNFRVFNVDELPQVDYYGRAWGANWTCEIDLGRQGSFVLHPKCFALAATLEWVSLGDDIAARLEGRSSLGKLGVAVHVTAGLVDPGWEGRIVLELANLGVVPVVLHVGLPICSLSFEEVSSRVRTPYRGRADNIHNGQDRP